METGISTQGAKPHGWVGRLLGRLMNKGQTALYRKIFREKGLKISGRHVDLACGGGAFLKMLAETAAHENRSFSGTGIDHSPDMIRLAESGKRIPGCEFREGSAVNLPLKEEEADSLTIMEAIQFMRPLELCLAGVHRVLKPGGVLIIMNRFPQPGSSWYEKVQIKSEQEYLAHLEKAGFLVQETDLSACPGWIWVKSVKKSR